MLFFIGSIALSAASPGIITERISRDAISSLSLLALLMKFRRLDACCSDHSVHYSFSSVAPSFSVSVFFFLALLPSAVLTLQFPSSAILMAARPTSWNFIILVPTSLRASTRGNEYGERERQRGKLGFCLLRGVRRDVFSKNVTLASSDAKT